MYHLAREDVIRVKKLVHSAHGSRERSFRHYGGAEPSQRAPNSLDRVRYIFPNYWHVLIVFVAH